MDEIDIESLYRYQVVWTTGKDHLNQGIDNLRKLERRVSVPLFEEVEGELKLSKTGKFFLPKSSNLVQKWEAILNEMHDFSEQPMGGLVIDVPQTVSYCDAVTDCLKKIYDLLPAQQISIAEKMVDCCNNSLCNGGTDFSFSMERPIHKELAYVEIYQSQPKVILPLGHPLLLQTCITSDDLQNQMLVCMEPGIYPDEASVTEFLFFNPPKNLRLVSDLATAIGYVQTQAVCALGCGVPGLMPEDVFVRTIDDLKPESIFLGWRRQSRKIQVQQIIKHFSHE
jgi:DNA-binding transcriptional LysR family regulator